MSKKKAKHNTETKNDKSINSRVKLIIITIIQIILIGVMIYSGIRIYNWIRENSENNRIKEELEDVVTEIVNDNAGETEVEEPKEEKRLNSEDYDINFSKLKATNPDTVGWLKVNNTQIQYAVVKAKDNDYYLNHSFNKSSNSAGWVFADYRNKIDGTDRNIIIYGHNRRDGSMFGSMQAIFTESWYNNDANRTIVFITENGKYNYEVFSVYRVEDESYYIQTSFTNDSFKKFVATIKKRSIKDFGVDVDENDQILTLSTCYSNNKYRVVLHAKKVVE